MKALTIFILFTYNLFAQNIQTYQASFVQNITNQSDKVISYTGKIYIKNPNKMLWKYIQPIEKYVYMNNKKIIIDEPELEQALYTTLTDEINLINFLNNPELIDKKYTLIYKNKQLITIKYIDEMENKININFKNITVNQPIPDQLFQFIAPLDYDIIRK